MATKKPIYFDNAATTIANPEVLNTYNIVKTKYYANPGSIHTLGQESKRILDKARKQILDLLECKNHKLIFTSGATEANNLAIKGFCLKYQNRGKHIITTNIEHPSVLEVFTQLKEYFGFEISYLPVNEDGSVSANDLKKLLRKDTILVSVMAVNNETGAINPIDDIAKLLKEHRNVVFHSDVTQCIGKLDINYDALDMFSFSAHKIHGLNSSGALILKRNIDLLPLFSGGGQEENLRSGTNDVAVSASLAKALRLSLETKDKNFKHISSLANTLKEFINNNKEEFELNSFSYNPYIVNFSLKNKKASVVVEALSNRNIYISSVSACHSRKESYSYAINNMGKSLDLSHNTLRISFSEENTLEEVETFIKELKSVLEGIR